MGDVGGHSVQFPYTVSGYSLQTDEGHFISPISRLKISTIHTPTEYSSHGEKTLRHVDMMAPVNR